MDIIEEGIHEEESDEEISRSDTEMNDTLDHAYDFPVLAKVNFVLFFKLLVDGSKKVGSSDRDRGV